jgi:hypothetical protein
VRSLSLCSRRCAASLWDRHPCGSTPRRLRPRRGGANGKLTDDRLGEPSTDVRTRLEKAREMQQERFAIAAGGSNGKLTLLCNAEMPAPPAQAVSPLRARGPNGAQVWARPRCANTAPWIILARACACVPPRGAARRHDPARHERPRLTPRSQAGARLFTFLEAT